MMNNMARMVISPMVALAQRPEVIVRIAARALHQQTADFDVGQSGHSSIRRLTPNSGLRALSLVER